MRGEDNSQITIEKAMNMIRIECSTGLIFALVFLVIGSIYSVTTPIFEASDEISHYPVIQHIASTGELPVQRQGVTTLWDQEGSQPPLYYLIGAALTRWIDTSDLESVRKLNPHRKLGIPLDTDNKNMVLHSAAESFPWNGTKLAVHLLRLFGVVLGGVTVYLTSLLSDEVFAGNRFIQGLACALVALNPMFLFISGSVNNDNLTVLLSTLGLLLCVRILRSGLTTTRMVTLAVVFALTSITKISGLTILPLMGVTVAIAAYKVKRWVLAGQAAAAVILVWLVIASWWYVRNMQLYGEVLGINTQILIAGGRHIGLIDLLLDEFYGFWVSYWALFGAVNLLASQATYVLFALLSVVGTVGFIAWIYRHVRSRELGMLLLPALLTLFICLIIVGLVRWTLMTYASQGRLVFPAIAAISLVLARGITFLTPPRVMLGSTIGISLTLFGVAAWTPFAFILPAYATAPIASNVPSDLTPVEINYDGLELIGAKTYDSVATAGGFIPVTIYWKATRPINEDLSIYVHALGRDYKEIGKIDSFPGGGTRPSSRLIAGEIVEDKYLVKLSKAIYEPTVVRLQVGVGKFTPTSYDTIVGTRSSGESASDAILEAGVVYPVRGLSGHRHTWIASDSARLIEVRFGDFAMLHALTVDKVYRAGDSINVEFYWEQTGSPGADWTVFVQLLSNEQRIVAQDDGPPAHNDYPTRAWKVPFVFHELRKLMLASDVAPGEYSILAGLYDSTEPALPRANAFDSSGSPYPNNAVLIATIRVQAP